MRTRDLGARRRAGCSRPATPYSPGRVMRSAVSRRTAHELGACLPRDRPHERRKRRWQPPTCPERVWAARRARQQRRHRRTACRRGRSHRRRGDAGLRHKRVRPDPGSRMRSCRSCAPRIIPGSSRRPSSGAGSFTRILDTWHSGERGAATGLSGHQSGADDAHRPIRPGACTASWSTRPTPALLEPTSTTTAAPRR